MNKILIVDDRKSNRTILIKILVRVGDFEFIEAGTGSEALSLYEKEDPDLILMDINMPDMDGFQSAAAIKKIMEDNYCPIIFVTALSNDDNLKQAIKAGGDDFIGKPVHAAVLESKIKAHLRIRELNKQLKKQNNQLKRLNQHLTQEQELIEHFFENSLKHSFLDPQIIKYHMSSMSAFAGDLFLVERGPEGGLFLVMGDFTGHGLTASMGTLPVVMIFSKMVAAGSTISEIATEINFQLHKMMPSGMFFAATLLKLAPEGDKITIWMGGLPESYRLSKTGVLKDSIHSQHMALGILSPNNFSDLTQSIDIDDGDMVYLYSDGIIEACNPEGEMLGDERFKDMLVKHQVNRFENVLDDFKLFTGASDQSDDITLVEMTCCKIEKPD